MTLPQSAELTGTRVPAFRFVPSAQSSSANEIVRLMRDVGVDLLPWQQDVLAAGLGMVRRDGAWAWAAFEVAMILARQNGKNVVFEARELGGLFLLGEKLILHTAHQFKTTQEAFRRIDQLLSTTTTGSGARSGRSSGRTARKPSSCCRGLGCGSWRGRKASGRGFTGEDA